MQMLIKHCRIISDSDKEINQTDILIENGQITQIAPSISGSYDQLVEGEDLWVSAGWLDLGVQAWDPGNEHREDLQTVRAAAAAGGYTSIALWPDTDPCVDSKSAVRYILDQSTDHPVALLPLGAISRDCAGKDITEMIDMQTAGAVAFSDGLHPVSDNGLLLRALLYVKSFDGLIIDFPLDNTIGGRGQMHEGVVSTSLGLPGIPTISEDLMVARDIQLLGYTNSRLHLANISTAGSVAQIRQAKAQGLKVTCSVPIWNLIFEDQALAEFDSLFKLHPPLREASDREALLEGLSDGTIDHISSNHMPWETEHKSLEFPYASFGANGLETTYSLIQTHLRDTFSPNALAALLGGNMREILGMDKIEIKAGATANLTVFDAKKDWTFDRNLVQSRSFNNPMIGKTLQGRIRAVVRDNWYMIQE